MEISRIVNAGRCGADPENDRFSKVRDFSVPGNNFYYVFNIDESEYEWLSDTIVGVIGFSAAELGAMEFVSNIHPADKMALANIISHLDDLAAEHGPEWLSHFGMMYDFRFMTKGGHYIRLLVQMTQTLEEESGCYKRYGKMTDITYLKNEGETTFSMLNLEGGESFIAVPLGPKETSVSPFSRREKDVVRLILQGNHLKDIADLLFISPDTVKNHKKNIFNKTGCKSSVQLFKLCVASGWRELYEGIM